MGNFFRRARTLGGGIFILLFISICACRKKTELVTYGVNFTVNGVAVNFTKYDSGSLGSYGVSPQDYYINFGATPTDSATTNLSSIYVVMSDKIPITTGYYDNDEPSMTIIPFKISLNYTTPDGQNYFSSDYLGDSSYIPLPVDNKIVLTEINSTYIKGTFQGTLVPFGPYTGNYITITNGAFTVHTAKRP